jgi:hypothetical protein
MRTKKPVTSDFVAAKELAEHFGVITDTLTGWVSRGDIPPPWIRPGERTRLWLRKHYDEMCATGRWPDAAWRQFKKGKTAD